MYRYLILAAIFAFTFSGISSAQDYYDESIYMRPTARDIKQERQLLEWQREQAEREREQLEWELRDLEWENTRLRALQVEQERLRKSRR